MGFNIETSVSALAVFIQGILSFFSPCVLPLVPLYISYLAGGAQTIESDGTMHYKRSRVMLNTLFFVVGVSFAFFLLGFGFSTIGRFFSGNRMIFARVGGILVVLFGLYQLGFFGEKFLGGRISLPFRLDKMAMSPFTALIMGFTFSFAWTPCVGPALASVLLMVSSAGTSSMGFVLIGLYTLGFVLPFLAVGIFTGTLLDLFKKYRKVVLYTTKAGGVLLIFMGIMMFTGWMNGITGYLSSFGNPTSPPSSSSSVSSSVSSSSVPETENPLAPDFTLIDQYDNTQKLSDYRGKVVFLNFWATWCGPCQKEMPDIQAIYEANAEDSELVILGVANPSTDKYPRAADSSLEDVKNFLTNGGYTYPVAMDLSGDVFNDYGVSAFPTTFMIDREGRIYGYVTGTITREIMDKIIADTLADNTK